MALNNPSDPITEQTMMDVLSILIAISSFSASGVGERYPLEAWFATLISARGSKPESSTHVYIGR